MKKKATPLKNNNKNLGMWREVITKALTWFDLVIDRRGQVVNISISIFLLFLKPSASSTELIY